MARMPRFKLLIEYAGTKYSGWQIQRNARTVQGEIDRAVREATGRQEFELYGSGRTDAGVHALAQIAHLELYTELTPELLRRRINDELPADIHIRSIAKAPHKFHARHDAVERSYLYQISTRRTAFGKPFVWWIREPLSVDKMREAAAAFVGLQNFEAFTADDPDEKSTKVLVDAVEIEAARCAHPDPGPRLAFSLEDGQADGRRAGGRGTSRDRAARGRGISGPLAHGRFTGQRSGAGGTRRGTVSRSGPLPGRSANRPDSPGYRDPVIERSLSARCARFSAALAGSGCRAGRPRSRRRSGTGRPD